MIAIAKAVYTTEKGYGARSATWPIIRKVSCQQIMCWVSLDKDSVIESRSLFPENDPGIQTGGIIYRIPKIGI